MGLSTAARVALTGLAKALSREVAVDNVTINNLLPERIDTDRQVFMAQRQAKEDGTSYEVARQKIAELAAGQAVRADRGVRRHVRVPVQRQRRLHHRPEHASRRRQLRGAGLRPTRCACCAGANSSCRRYGSSSVSQ